MPFCPACSIDGCLKLFEQEIKLSLCPKRKKRTLVSAIEKLRRSKDSTWKTITDSANNEEREIHNDVEVWLGEVDKLSAEVDELLSSLSTNGCWQLRSNYISGQKVDEKLSSIADLREDRKRWDTDDKLFNDSGRDPPPTARGIPEGSSMAREEARTLFSSYLMGGAVDFTGNIFIEQRARKILRTLVECCGSSKETLDLAMRVVAASLKNYGTVREWKEAAEGLRSIAASKDNIVSDGTPILERILRFCYDSMGSEQLRACLSSCASFDLSSSRPIHEVDIIYYWMGEGLLDDRADFHEAYEQGPRVIEKLWAAHWLRSSNWCDLLFIMDDHIQSMVQKASGHMVIPTSTTAEGAELQSWSESGTTRVLVKQPVSSLPHSSHAFTQARLPEGTPECPHLVSLLLGDSESMKIIHDDFFRFTPKLLVLDLSRTDIKELPPSIGLLKFLRLLNLTKTRISSLPIELGDMEDLRLLLLDDTRELKGIRRECITKLSKLRLLKMSENGHEWNQLPGSEYLSMEDLRRMTGIQQLSLTARTNSELDKMRSLFGSVLTGLTLQGRDFTDTCSVLSSLDRLDFFELISCPRLEDLVIRSSHLGRVRRMVLQSLNIKTIAPESAREGGPAGGFGCFLPTLRQLVIRQCHCLRNLTWIGHLPKLEFVLLEDCGGISMLIDKGGPFDSSAGSEEADDGGVSFPNLQLLLLSRLPGLSSFSWRHHPLRLPSLRTLLVVGCPQLKKLPLGRGSCNDIREIHGTWEWWDSLQWDSSDIRDKFGAYYEPGH